MCNAIVVPVNIPFVFCHKLDANISKYICSSIGRILCITRSAFPVWAASFATAGDGWWNPEEHGRTKSIARSIFCSTFLSHFSFHKLTPVPPVSITSSVPLLSFSSLHELNNFLRTQLWLSLPTAWLQQHLVDIVHTLPPLKVLTVSSFSAMLYSVLSTSRRRGVNSQSMCNLAFLMIAWTWRRRTSDPPSALLLETRK